MSKKKKKKKKVSNGKVVVNNEPVLNAKADDDEAKAFAERLELNLASILGESDDDELPEAPTVTETSSDSEPQQAPSQEAAPVVAAAAAETAPIVDEEKPPRRIWEVDFVRGLMILFVVWDHLMCDINSVGESVYNTAFFRWMYTLSIKYYGGALRAVTHDVFVTLFIVTSGISCSFSRSNGKRALKMCLFAILFSAVTYGASAMFGMEITIYFNVIHVIALSVAIYAGIEWIWSKLRKNWQKNLFGVCYFAVTMFVLVLGHCAKYMGMHWTDLLFGTSEWRTKVIDTMVGGGDYLSFFPDFGWFLVGAFLGKIVYRKKETLFPSVDTRFVSPVTFCGRYSIWIYFGSQAVMFGLIYLLHVVFSLL